MIAITIEKFEECRSPVLQTTVRDSGTDPLAA
jgi:hypothetical protein